MRIVYFQRKSDIGHFSLEGYFTYVRREMDCIDGNTTRLKVSRFFSQGLLKRLWMMVEAFFSQGDINHIAGDIHFVALFLRPSRTVLTIADCEALERFRGFKHTIMLWFWYVLPISWSKVVTVISEFSKQELLRHTGCKGEKVRVVYVCISDAYRMFPREFNSFCPTILQVGAAHNKNIPRLASALKGISCKLRVIGKLKDYQIAALEENKVDYTYVYNLSESELVKEYEQCDLLAFVSTYEGFGMPILEVQAVGRPVVTSNCCSMPEVGGSAVCYVDPENVDSIREGILKVIREDGYRAELLTRGYENVKRFSPSVIAREYYQIYQTLL